MSSLLFKGPDLSTGWRRSGMVNVGLMSASLAILIGVLAAAISATGEVGRAWKFYEADCRDSSTSTTNTLLHLLLNALSSVVLASSNFFMQVLNAPSRREVDAAHAKGDWLDIGIPSWRNAFRLSWFKTAAWMALFLTSIPIHVVFNSSIFLINTRTEDYHVTFAAESFLSGGKFYLPGASLYTSDIGMAYGKPAQSHDFADYLNNDFAAELRNVSKAAAHSNWERLEARDCGRMISSGSCSGLKGYQSFVVVAQGDGWKRSGLWNLTAIADAYWEKVVPRDNLNSLWYSTQCQMNGDLQGATAPYCNTSCAHILPDQRGNKAFVIDMFTWYRSQHREDSSSKVPWSSNLYSASWNTSQFGLLFDSPYFDSSTKSSAFDVSYCLAELRESRCAVTLSKPLFLAVAVSILLKLVICVIVIIVLGPQQPLVTPGDAISSFISDQEGGAQGSGFITQSLVRNHRETAGYQSLQPYEWVKRQHRKYAAVPGAVWFTTYFVLVLGICVAGSCLGFQLSTNILLRWVKLNSGEASSVLLGIPSQASFVSSVIVANIPQLYLSFWYLAYNSLITRMEMAREWAMFSVRYRPLRVTRPKGQQIATYRLQLPYKYSITLIMASILLHWLLSNALFIIVSEGSYYDSESYFEDTVSLPRNASVAIGTASLPVLLLVVIATPMVLFPVFLSSRHLPGYMPVVGSNSLAMWAASRVSPLAKIPKLDNDGDENDGERGTELEELVSESNRNAKDASVRSDSRENMAYRLLKWGEVKMPDAWHRQMEEDGQATDEVRHLSFGTVLDNPQPPMEGRLYM